MKLLFLSLFTAIFIVFLHLLWLKIAGNNVRKSRLSPPISSTLILLEIGVETVTFPQLTLAITRVSRPSSPTGGTR